MDNISLYYFKVYLWYLDFRRSIKFKNVILFEAFCHGFCLTPHAMEVEGEREGWLTYFTQFLVFLLFIYLFIYLFFFFFGGGGHEIVSHQP